MKLYEDNLKEIWLAGGCFWGVEAFIARLYGVHEVTVGYVNGNTENPSYEEVCSGTTNYAEAVHVRYSKDKISLKELLEAFLKIIDPTSKNRQGNDVGSQYRTGIYYKDEEDKRVIEEVLLQEQNKYQRKIVTEVLPLKNYYLAEEYHQNYLEKNPNGYCHIDLSLAANEIIIDQKDYKKPLEEDIKKSLNEIEFKVTQENGTEAPFSNKYWNSNERGIYVDIVTGEPLFSSSDKFDCECGWPSFARPIIPEVVTYKQDNKFNMVRTEVRSRSGDSHLGHVFDDGPRNLGGKRYCINGGALRFISYDNMEEQGYGYIKHTINK